MGVILIAFERESELSALDQLLSGRGHQVVRSGSGLAALEAARRDPPHAIVSDIVLPRMDGFALCRKWKQDERLRPVPFIFYTRRHDDPKYERFALELGAERFLARSVAPQELLSALDQLLPDSAKQAAAAPLLEEEVSRSASSPVAQKDKSAASEKIPHAQARTRFKLAELEATNKRLAAGEARFRRLFEANPLPMWIVDHATGRFIAVNEAALSAHGYTRAEFLALGPAALQAPSGPDDPASLRTHRRSDGGTLTFAVASQSIEFDGRDADLVCAYDITERLAGERRLQEQAASARAMLDTLADGCWVLDGSGRLLDVNRAYCRMSGYSRDELLKMDTGRIEDQSVGETTLRLQLGRVSGGGRYEAKHRRADGSLFDVEVTVGLLERGQGDSIALIRDVTERRREMVAQRTALRQLEFLVELFKQSETFDESAIVRRMIEQAAEATRSPLGFLYLVDSARKTLTLAAWRERGLPHAVTADAEPRSLARAGLLAECVRSRRATSSNDLAWKPQPDGLPDLQRFVAVPLIADDETVAVLGVANREGGYGEQDQSVLMALAEGVWRVLHAKRAHAQTLGSLQRTDVALQGMIDALVRMSERHDPYTAGSSRRLAALAVALGREAGLDGERQHALRVAALLHDIGNIAVPTSVLAKPAPLSEAEVALVRTHVEAGQQVLAGVDFGAPVAQIIHQMHERCDGSGYPSGLKGEEIMLEARILGIADTVEAMCSPRPYRPALGMEAAIDEINRGAGRLYDLHIVAACTRLVRQHGFVLP
jgi:PAS domain S-box-containing protein